MVDPTQDVQDIDLDQSGEPQTVDAGGGDVTTESPDDANTTDVDLGDTGGQYSAQTVAPSPTQEITGALGAQQEANTAEAEAKAQQGSAEQLAYQNAAGNLAQLPTQNDIVAGYQQRDQQLAKAFTAKQIDPNHFYNNLGTAGKVEAGIGMLLSGFGGGASRQPSMAMKVLDDAVTRDIDAQKNAQGQAMTLWQMNRNALGTDLAANLATQNQMMTGLQTKINLAAAQFKGPIALANAQQANALIEQQKAQNNLKLSMFGPATQESPDPATRVGQMQRFGLITPEQAASSLKEIKSAADINTLTPRINAAFQQASSKNPVVAAQGAREFQGLMNTTVTEQEGTARQAAFDSIHKNMTPSGPTALPGENETKFRTVQEYLASKSAAPFSSSIGIHLNQFPTTKAPTVPTRAPAPAPGSNTQGGVPMKLVRFQGKVYKVPVK